MLSGQAWTIPADQITIEERVGGGAFGLVWRGTYAGSPVALKQLFSGMADPSNVAEVRVPASVLYCTVLWCMWVPLPPPARVHLGLSAYTHRRTPPPSGSHSQLRVEATLLSQLHHPNVLHFYGICPRGNEVFLVTEFCPASVLSYLMNPNADHGLHNIAALALQVARVSRGPAATHPPTQAHCRASQLHHRVLTCTRTCPCTRTCLVL